MKSTSLASYSVWLLSSYGLKIILSFTVLLGDPNSWLCVHECVRPVTQLSRNSANKGKGVAGAGTKQQWLPRVYLCLCVSLTIPLTSFCWETESEEVSDRSVFVCVWSLSVTMCPPQAPSSTLHSAQTEAEARGQMRARSVKPQSKTNKRWTGRVEGQ